MKSQASKVDSGFGKILDPASNSWYESYLNFIKRNWREIISTFLLVMAIVVALMYNPNKIQNFWQPNIRLWVLMVTIFFVSSIIGFFLKNRKQKIFLVNMLVVVNLISVFPQIKTEILLFWYAFHILIFVLILKGNEMFKYRMVSITLIVFCLISVMNGTSFIWKTSYLDISLSLGILTGFLMKETFYFSALIVDNVAEIYED